MKIGLTLYSAALARRSLLTAFCALGLSAMTTASQARDIGSYGSQDGTEFRQTCERGHVLIGFSMKTGKALDAVNPICIALTPQRHWTGEAYEMLWAGGGGGDYQKIACEPGYAVTHLHVYKDRHGAVNHIRLTCQDLNSGNWNDQVPGQIGGEANGDQRFSCGPGEYGSGIYGRSHGLVTNLGLQCETVAAAPAPAAPVVAAPAPTPAPEPAPAPAGNVQVVADVTGYAVRGGPDSCYFAPLDTAQLIKVDEADQNWVFVKGMSGGCLGQEVWVYNGGELRL